MNGTQVTKTMGDSWEYIKGFFRKPPIYFKAIVSIFIAITLLLISVLVAHILGRYTLGFSDDANTCPDGKYLMSISSPQKSEGYNVGVCIDTEILGKSVKDFRKEIVWCVILLLIFFALSIYKEYLDKRVVKEREFELGRQIEKMPSYQSMTEFFKAVYRVRENDYYLRQKEIEMVSSGVSKSKANVDLFYLKIEYLRFYLNSIAKLARLFHLDSYEARFASNVMLVKTTDMLFSQGVRERDLLRFCREGKGTDLKAYPLSYLCLEPILSASTDIEDEKAKDSSIESIYLPIPDNTSEAIPSAVKEYLGSFTFGSHSILRNCREVLTNKDYFHLSLGQRKELDKYFNQTKQGRQIRSIISVQLHDALRNRCVAVLNVHADIDDLFLSEERREQFIRIITPLSDKIAGLIFD